MKANDLLICTANILKLLSDLFYAGKIDFDVLKSNSSIKLNFLENKLDEFENLSDKELAVNLIEDYRTIFSANK